MAHDALVFQKASDVGRAIPGDSVEIEAIESTSEVLAFGQDGSPTESRLERFQADFFEKAVVIGDGITPFEVVVGLEFRGGGCRIA